MADHKVALPATGNTAWSGWASSVDGAVKALPDAANIATKGEVGVKGDKGDPGDDGAAGAIGRSAYQVWLDIVGNEGKSVEQFILAITGAKGDKGDKGDTGATGPGGGGSAIPTQRTPEQFGAVGDGVTDDQTALANMLAACVAGDVVLLNGQYRHSNILTVPAAITVMQYGRLIASDPTRAAFQISTAGAGTKLRGFWNEVDWGSTAPVRGGTDVLTAPLALWDTHSLDIDGVTSKLSRQCGVYISTVKRSKIRNVDVYRSQADSFHMTHNCEDLEIDNVIVSYSGDDGVAVVSYRTRGSGTGAPAVDPCRRIRVRGIRTRYGHARGASIVGGVDITYTNLDINWTRAGATYMGNESGYNTHPVVRCVMRHGVARDVGYPIPPSGSSTPDAGLDHGHLFFLAQQADTVNLDSGYEDWTVSGGGPNVYNFCRAISNNATATYSGCYYRRIRAVNGKERDNGINQFGGSTAGVTYTDLVDDRTPQVRRLADEAAYNALSSEAKGTNTWLWIY